MKTIIFVDATDDTIRVDIKADLTVEGSAMFTMMDIQGIEEDMQQRFPFKLGDVATLNDMEAFASADGNLNAYVKDGDETQDLYIKP